LLSFLLVSAICIVAPVDGPVVAGYAPVGQYAGHWGVDFAAPPGAVVRAPATGVVTFAGSVAGMQSITIEPVPGFKVSVSYLSGILFARGSRVVLGSALGTSGLAHGTPSVHLSTRIGGSYLDPLQHMGCRRTEISRALRLVTPPQSYPRSRANRNSRRNLRPDTRRPSSRRRNRTGSREPRSGLVRPSRRSLAKVRSKCQSRPPPLGNGPPRD
jgi:murein DD-endopeptidase MepM/ murein hydrolase activator NlpD